MSAARSLLLARCWLQPAGPRWLAVDLAGTDRILDLPGPDQAPADLPDAIVIAPLDGEPRALPGGGIFLPEGVLWSFLDPLHAQVPLDSESDDRISLEKDLRRLAGRFRRRLAWWQGLPGALRQSCRDKVRGFKPDLSPWLDQLDRVPVILADEPEAGEADLPGPVPHRAVAPAPEPETIYQWFASPEGLGSVYGDHFSARQEQAEMAREVIPVVKSTPVLAGVCGTDPFRVMKLFLRDVDAAIAPGTSAEAMIGNGPGELVVVTDSLSKRYSACGIRLGCLATRNRGVWDACLRMAQGRLSPPGLAQLVALGASELGPDYEQGLANLKSLLEATG